MADANSLRKPQSDPRPDDYDEVLDESFPASDPPPGVIKLGGAGRVRKPAPASQPMPDAYDEVVAQSFPASDPPPGIIKVGPRKKRPGRA